MDSAGPAADDLDFDSAAPRTPLRNSQLAQLLAGATAGLASCLMLQPFDVLKTRLQLEPSDKRMAGRLGFLKDDIISAIQAQGGHPKLMWRGTAASVMRSVPGVALYFSSLDAIRYQIASSRFAEMPAPARDAIAGGSARALAVMLLMPFTVAKTRIESGLLANKFATTGDVLRDVVRQRGVMGLWSGWGATLVRDVPAGGMFVALYEAIKKRIGTGYFEMTEPEIRAVSSLAAASVTTIATHPIDVLKTHVQTNPAENRNVFVSVVKLLRNDGFRVFLNGLAPRTIRKSFQASIAWSIYEGFSDFMDFLQSAANLRT